MEENKYVIGLDLGGTNAVFGLVDENYEIKATGSLLTQEYTLATAFVEDAAEVISELSSVAGGIENIKAIGIGAPCGNYNAGTIEHAANISWGKGVVPICQMLNEKTGIPVAITNDAKAAALGEMSHGAAMGMKDFIEITLGTGVGSGIVANGNLIYGSDGFACFRKRRWMIFSMEMRMRQKRMPRHVLLVEGSGDDCQGNACRRGSAVKPCQHPCRQDDDTRHFQCCRGWRQTGTNGVPPHRRDSGKGMRKLRHIPEPRGFHLLRRCGKSRRLASETGKGNIRQICAQPVSRQGEIPDKHPGKRHCGNTRHCSACMARDCQITEMKGRK